MPETKKILIKIGKVVWVSWIWIALIYCLLTYGWVLGDVFVNGYQAGLFACLMFIFIAPPICAIWVVLWTVFSLSTIGKWND